MLVSGQFIETVDIGHDNPAFEPGWKIIEGSFPKASLGLLVESDDDLRTDRIERLMVPVIYYRTDDDLPDMLVAYAKWRYCQEREKYVYRFWYGPDDKDCVGPIIEEA